MDTTTLVAALLMATGIAGLIVPVLPGLLCVVLGVLVWALGHPGPLAWSVFGAACVIAAIGFVVQYRVPGRRLSSAGIPGRSSLIGVVLGVVGFFVVPFVGLPLGFVLGVFLAELARLRQWDVAWRATVAAVKAAVLSVDRADDGRRHHARMGLRGRRHGLNGAGPLSRSPALVLPTATLPALFEAVHEVPARSGRRAATLTAARRLGLTGRAVGGGTRSTDASRGLVDDLQARRRCQGVGHTEHHEDEGRRGDPDLIHADGEHDERHPGDDGERSHEHPAAALRAIGIGDHGRGEPGVVSRQLCFQLFECAPLLF